MEKFIGDAVMAVWGTPVAREDDTERAVRAALALRGAVGALADEVEMPGLRVRAGVLTGNAAVEVGAEGEGMVLGDTVNTARRLQSIAEPGTVLVDDVTRRASEAAIAYEDAGTHQVKGPRAARSRLDRAAGRRRRRRRAPARGSRHRSSGVTASSRRSSRPPSTARAEEAPARRGRRRGRARKVAPVVGVLQVPRRDRGASLVAPGPVSLVRRGGAYWALAEMVRARARIRGGRARDGAWRSSARRRGYVPEEREQRLVEPRLAHLLRLEERPEADRADLFSGWRLFFERMSERHR